MTHLRFDLRGAFFFGVLASLGACSPRVVVQMQPPPDGMVMMMPPPGDASAGPVSCTMASDCTNACPPNSLRCDCAALGATRVCLPACIEQGDCPTLAMGSLTCNTQTHICTPPTPDGGMTPPPGDGGMMPPPGDGGMPPPGDGAMPPPGDGAMPPPGDGGMMARSCTAASECTSACPGARGCTCASTPMGMVCVPTCSTATDCPMGPAGVTLQCRMGICAP